MLGNRFDSMRGHILILTANILFGISVPVFKCLLNSGIPPEVIAFLRAAVTCVLFWLLSIFLPQQRVTRCDLGLLAVCGICGVGINQLLFVVGLRMTSPVDGSIIASATPIFALLLAAVILREPVTKRKSLGVTLGVCGGLLLVFGSTHTASGESSVLGDAMIAVNYMVYALYLVLSRSLAGRYSIVTIMKWMFLVATVALFPFSVGELGHIATSHASAFQPMQLYGLLYVTVGSTFIAFLLVTCSLKSLRPTTVSMYNYVQPMVACAIAIAIGQDVFSIVKLGSLLLVFTGVYLVTTSRSKQEPSTTKK